MVKKVGSKYKLYTQDGSRVLGTHDTRLDAIRQEIAIQESEKREAKKGKK